MLPNRWTGLEVGPWGRCRPSPPGCRLDATQGHRRWRRLRGAAETGWKTLWSWWW